MVVEADIELKFDLFLPLILGKRDVVRKSVLWRHNHS